MAEQPYKEPPITEAVIELRFATPTDAADMAKVGRDLRSLYPLQHPITDLRVELNLPSSQQAVPTAHPIETHGSRLSTDDETELVLIWPRVFVCSQLAPYPGWDAF